MWEKASPAKKTRHNYLIKFIIKFIIVIVIAFFVCFIVSRLKIILSDSVVSIQINYLFIFGVKHC